ncbi:MFS transporter [Alphaproteobacteria bacterium]|nr:MFS transporter [Alphaproteobacteria bacterium]
MKNNKYNNLYYYLFDWANSPFSTIIITFVFSSYFTNTIADNKISGTSLWGWTIAISGFLIAILSPYLGHLADVRKSFSKRFLLFSTVVVVVLSFSLWYADKNINIFLFLFVILVSNIFFEIGQAFYNSQFINFVGTKRYGEFSGTAWAFGYLGGIFCLIFILIFFLIPEKSIFNLNEKEYENIRVCGPIVGSWFLIFSIPFLINCKAHNITKQNYSFFYFIKKLKLIKKDSNKIKFFLSRMLYTDGLITLFSFGGIYATGTFNFSFNDIILFGIAINISAALGAYIFGFIEDIIGIKKVIIASLILLIGICILILIIDKKLYFWILGTMLGLFIGSIQSSSRTALIRLSDKKNINSLFGIYAMSGKITNFLGPLLVATFTAIFESQKAGMATILIFLSLGLILFSRVRL